MKKEEKIFKKNNKREINKVLIILITKCNTIHIKFINLI